MATRKAVAPPPPPPGFEIIPASVPPPPPGFELIDGATPVNPYEHPRGAKPAPPMTQGERKDRALEAIPPALAMAATLPLSGPAALGGMAARGFWGLARAALTRTAVAAFAGGTGSALQSNLQLMMDTPGKPKDSRELVVRAGKTALTEGGTQLGGEALGVASKTIGLGAGWLSRRAPGSTGGQQYYAKKWVDLTKAQDAAREAKADTAASVMESLSQHVEPHEVGEIGADAVKLYRETFLASERAQYGSFQAALKGSKIDYTDIADDLIRLEAERPKARGGLSKFTEADAEWADLIERMKKGQKAKVGRTRKGVEGFEVDGEVIDPGVPSGIKIEKATNSAEAGDAVVVARSTVSQRLHEVRNAGGYTREYVEGLERTLAGLDRKIKSAAFDVDPTLAAGYSELLKFSGSHREILKQSFMQMAEKRQKDLSVTLLSSSRPEWVDMVRLMVKEGAMSPENFAKVQRAGLESLLLRTKNTGEKVLDLENFATRLDATGAAGKRLFADPQAKQTVENIRTLSRELKAMPKKPQQAGIPIMPDTESRMGEMAVAALGFRYTGMVFLPRELYSSLNRYIIAVADNPAAHRKMVAAIRAAKGVGKWSPTAGNLAADAFRTAKVYDGLKALFEPQPVPSHEVRE